MFADKKSLTTATVYKKIYKLALPKISNKMSNTCQKFLTAILCVILLWLVFKYFETVTILKKYTIQNGYLVN